MSGIKDRRIRSVKRRNPVARTLRERLFRQRAVASRKKYTRKLKHRHRTEPDPPPER